MEDLSHDMLTRNARAEIDELRQLAAEYRLVLEELKAARKEIVSFLSERPIGLLQTPFQSVQMELEKLKLQAEIKELRELGRQLRTAKDALQPEAVNEKERSRRAVEIAIYLHDQGMKWKDIADELSMDARQLRRLRNDYSKSGQVVR